MKISEIISEANFGSEEVPGNQFTQFKEKYPNLSTLMYFIPGFGQALMVADVASAVQMYNQAIEQIEKKYPPTTIKTIQQKVGDDDDWETIQ